MVVTMSAAALGPDKVGPAPRAVGTAKVTSDLSSSWRDWRPGRGGPSGSRIVRRRSHGLVLRLAPDAPKGTVAFFRLRLSPRVKPIAMTFRISFVGRGAQAFISSGRLGSRRWQRSGTAHRRTRVAKVTLRGRVVFVGLRRAVRPSRVHSPQAVVLHSYSITVGGTASGPSAGGGPAQPSAPRPRIYWGARVGGNVGGNGFGDAPYDMRSLTAFESDAGKRVSLLLWGQTWFDGGVPHRFAPELLERVRQHGAIPILDWSPWDLAAGGYHEQPDFQLADVIAGTYDPYIREWATAAAAWGKPFYLRFCHEMNGTWYPWSERRNGNSQGQFVLAWRHVHDIFESVGATNVTWVWGPNEESGSTIPLAGLYPGDAYVDWMGMSGYNWGGDRGWRSFAKTFGSLYGKLHELAPTKPVMVAETAAPETGGSKAAWIRDALAVQLPTAFPNIKAFVWWNKKDAERNWVIESSPSARAAFANGIGSPYYASGHFAGLAPSPIPPP
jgi:hypothetical protein